MRDPARIPKLLDLIRQIWEDNPDMRLMQLLISASIKANKATGQDIYYLEDDELEKLLQERYGG